MRRLSPWSERLMTAVESTFASFVEKHLPRKQRQSATQRSISTWLTPALFAERTSRRETLLVTTTLNSIQTKSCLRGQPARIDAFPAWNKLQSQLFWQTSLILEPPTALSQNLQHKTHWQFVSLEFAALLESMIHRGFNGTFECTNCGKSCADKKGIRRHVETHMDMRHSCQLCDKVSKTRVGLAQHYAKYHSSEVVSPWAMSWTRTAPRLITAINIGTPILMTK